MNILMDSPKRDAPMPAVWDPAAYRDGYHTRYAGQEATCSSLCFVYGWRDADLELVESARQQALLTAGLNVSFQETGSELYVAGRMAHNHDLPFDDARTQPWKLGWMDADGERAREE